jgi:uncharacterized membrane protein YhiD involved in acid resistance
MLTALFWKKVWIWIKHHWYVPVIVVLIIGSSVTKNTIKDKLYKMLSDQRDLYEKEKELVVEVSKEKELEKERVRGAHEELVRKLEEEYDVELQKLKKDKQKELTELAEKHKDDGEDLARKIAEILGAEYVESEDG